MLLRGPFTAQMGCARRVLIKKIACGAANGSTCLSYQPKHRVVLLTGAGPQRLQGFGGNTMHTGKEGDGITWPRTRLGVLACMFHTWYFHFEQFTPRSEIIPLPHWFTSYLQRDQIFVRDDDDAHGAVGRSVRRALARLGGVAFAKLNWSSPKDASFMKHQAGGALRCTSTRDVYLYLKSSAVAMHDIGRMARVDDCVGEARVPLPERTRSGSHGGGMVLVLRKWCTLSPAMEFRCFVVRNSLVAMCQRHCAHYYPFLAKERRAPGPGVGMGVRYLVTNFWERVVHRRFGARSYSMDVYVDRRRRVWILGFGVLGPPMDPLLFTWDEIAAAACSDNAVSGGGARRCELRVVESRANSKREVSARVPVCPCVCPCVCVCVLSLLCVITIRCLSLYKYVPCQRSAAALNRVPLELSLGQIT